MINSTHYFKLGRVILFIVAVVLVGQTLLAQNSINKKDKSRDKKVHVKIVKEKDGVKEVFEKEYKNQKEMNKDSELQALQKDILIPAEPPLPEMVQLPLMDQLIILDSVIEDPQGKKIIGLHRSEKNYIIHPPSPPLPPSP